MDDEELIGVLKAFLTSLRDRGTTLILGGTRYIFLLILYNFKNIEGVARVPRPPPPCSGAPVLRYNLETNAKAGY